jgi:Domain of unknown function (DUF6883)
MKLPNGEQAIVEDRKLLEYVLNPIHPVGKHHALLFSKLLGIDLGNAHVLKEALLTAALNRPVDAEIVIEEGRKYEMRFTMSGPAGVKTVLAVWIINLGTERPRLVTCYVE